MDALSTLQSLGAGQILDDLYDALAVTAAEVVMTGNAGTVTVTFKLGNQGVGDRAVNVEPALKRQPPSRNMRGSYFFAKDGELFRSDPDQIAMDFRAVDPQQEVRTAASPGREERKA